MQLFLKNPFFSIYPIEKATLQNLTGRKKVEVNPWLSFEQTMMDYIRSFGKIIPLILEKKTFESLFYHIYPTK